MERAHTGKTCGVVRGRMSQQIGQLRDEAGFVASLHLTHSREIAIVVRCVAVVPCRRRVKIARMEDLVYRFNNVWTCQ